MIPRRDTRRGTTCRLAVRQNSAETSLVVQSRPSRMQTAITTARCTNTCIVTTNPDHSVHFSILLANPRTRNTAYASRHISLNPSSLVCSAAVVRRALSDHGDDVVTQDSLGESDLTVAEVV